MRPLVGHGSAPVFLDSAERFRHLYVSDQTGTGKSSLLLNLALQDIASGAGFAVRDPHGDLVEAILEHIPDHRLEDVVLVDAADPIAVVGVNLLEAETTVQAEHVVSDGGVPLDPFVVRTDRPRLKRERGRAELIRQRSRDQWARPVAEPDPEFFDRWRHVEGSLERAT